MKSILLLFSLCSFAFATTFTIRIESKSEHGYYTCVNPKYALNKDKAWYQSKEPKWNCKVVAITDEMEQTLESSIGRVLVVEGANLQGPRPASMYSVREMHLFIRRLAD